MQEYRAKYPEAALSSVAHHERYAASRARCGGYYAALPTCAAGCGKQVRFSWNKYCSRTCALRHRMSRDGLGEQVGDKNWRTRRDGGRYRYLIEQKAVARVRDDGKCADCGKMPRGKGLHVHHIIPRRLFGKGAAEADRADNLVTLCVGCHSRRDRATRYRFAELAVERFDHAELRELLKPCLPSLAVIDSPVPKEASC